MKSQLTRPVALFGCALLVCAAASAQVTYDVIPLPSRVGHARIAAEAISNKSTVVGTASGNPAQGFVWRNRKLMRLPALGGTCSYGNGISELEHVVGTSCLPGDAVHHATFWHGGQIIDIDTFGGAASSALRINRHDSIAGIITELDGSFRGYFWNNGTWSDIGGLGGAQTIPLGINDGDVITGQSDISLVPDPRFHIPPFHGIRWQGGALTDLGQIFGADFVQAVDIDGAGRIAGSADLAGDQAAHAFVWANGSVTDLGTYPGDVVSWANGMNNVGDVVGSSGQVDHHQGDGPPVYSMLCPCRAVLWHNGQVIDLDKVIPFNWKLQWASAINDQGEIVARAWKPADETVLLVPSSHAPAHTRRGTTNSKVGEPKRLIRGNTGAISAEF
jgi:probable HAF family extracellular repeat protein